MDIIKTHKNYEITIKENMYDHVTNIFEQKLHDEKIVRKIRFIYGIISAILLLICLNILSKNNLNELKESLFTIIAYVSGASLIYAFYDNRTKLIRKKSKDIYSKEIRNEFNFFKHIENADIINIKESKKEYEISFKNKNNHIENAKISKNKFYKEKQKYGNENIKVLDFTEFDWEAYIENYLKNYGKGNVWLKRNLKIQI